MREDELTRILQAGAMSVTEKVRPRPAEVIRARGDRRRRHHRLGSALLALAVIAAGGGVYAGVHTGTGATPAVHQPTPGPGRHVVRLVPVPPPSGLKAAPGGGLMLPAGKVGTRAQIPWPIVGSGWTLTEFTTTDESSLGSWATDRSLWTLSVVDPEGGRYTLYQQAGQGQPWTLLAMDAGQAVLLGVGSPDSQGRYPSYRVLATSNGAVSTFSLPAGVTPGGLSFSGDEVLTVRRTRTHAWLQAYSLTGHLVSTVDSENIPPGEASSRQCAPSCNALLSPDGGTVAWNDGAGLRLVGAEGLGRSEAMSVPGAGSACVPLSWWDDQTVLASCGSGARARLWLVRDDGQSPAALTPAGSAASSYGPYTGAWRLAGTLYVNRAAGASCPSTASGPGTSGFYSTGRNGALRPLVAPGGTQANVVGMDADALLLLACTGSSGGSGLMVYYVNAPRAAPIWLQRGTSGQAGVVAAVPFDQPGVVEAVPYLP